MSEKITEPREWVVKKRPKYKIIDGEEYGIIINENGEKEYCRVVNAKIKHENPININSKPQNLLGDFVKSMFTELFGTIYLVLHLIIFLVLYIVKLLLLILNIKVSIKFSCIKTLKESFERIFSEKYNNVLNGAWTIFGGISVFLIVFTTPLKYQIFGENEIIEVQKEIDHNKEYKEFAKAMRERESSNRYKVVNKSNHYGAFQFGIKALKDLDIADEKGRFKKKKFYNNEKLQDECFYNLCKINKNRLIKKGNLFKKYVGKTINGIKITKNGLIAGAHLVGAENVRKYLISKGKTIPKDGNKTTVEEYIKIGNKYKFDIEKVNDYIIHNL